MTIIDLGNGMFKLTAPNGVKDTRNGRVYREAVVHQNEIKFFVAA